MRYNRRYSQPYGVCLRLRFIGISFFIISLVVSPGSSCAEGERCTGGSMCIDRICTCPRGQIVMSDECVNAPEGLKRNYFYPTVLNLAIFQLFILVGPLSSCANGETCSGGSYCQNGMCTCPSDTTVRNAQCVRQRMGR